MATEVLGPFYMVSTRSKGCGLWVSKPRTAVGAVREMGGAYQFLTVGRLVPTGFLA